MRRWFTLLILLVAHLRLTAPLFAAQQRPSQEVVLGENDGLKAIVRLQSPANLANVDWLQLEILNNGPAARIKTARLVAPSEHDGWKNSNDLFGVTLGIATKRNDLSSIGNMIPEGAFTTSAPGVFVGASYGVPKSDVLYTMQVVLTLELEDGRSLATRNPVSLSFIWAQPNAVQIEALQREAVDLLSKAMPGPTALSAPELARLRSLMSAEETSRAVTLEQALAALKQRQVEGSFRFDEVFWLVYKRWGTNPAVIAFYRDALQTRGPEAVSDLARFSTSLWDDSFLEPLLQVIESAAQRPVNDSALSRGVNFLERNYSSWSQNSSIPPRLSAAVREVHAVLKPQSGGAGAFYNFVDLLAKTHDRAMIWFLREYLNDSTIDGFTSLSANMPAGVTPMRHREVAANGISQLLGEPILFDPWKRARAPAGGPYPEWAEWDKQITALQQRLEAMPKP